MYVPRHFEMSDDDAATLAGMVGVGHLVTSTDAGLDSSFVPFLVDDHDRLIDLVTRLTNLHEGRREAPWAVSDASAEFIDGQLKAIVGIEPPHTSNLFDFPSSTTESRTSSPPHPSTRGTEQTSRSVMTATPNRAGSAGPTDSRAWVDEVVRRTDAAFADQGDATRAEGAERYMKHVAPFLGIDTPERRRLLRAAWRGLSTPTSDVLGRAAAALMARREREYHYAAYDLLAQFIDAADEQFLRRWVTQLLTTTPWWDTVDGIGTAAVSPLCRRFDSAATIDEWSESGDRWLVRAAIQHQRGWRRSTDVERVLGLCHRHWVEREFFIAKAIGWALRDLTRIEPDAVRRFLTDHRGNAVAEREAMRGLTRAARGSTSSPASRPQER